MAHEITEAFIQEVGDRLADNRSVRRTLAGTGRLHVDRRVPFLCVHRKLPGGDEGEETWRLVVGEAAYLVAVDEGAEPSPLSQLVERIAHVMTEAFGAFLLLEVWAAPGSPSDGGTPDVPAATFRIYASSLLPNDPTVRQLELSLAEIPLRPPPLDVEVVAGGPVSPPSLPPLLPDPPPAGRPWHSLGIEIQPVYRQARTGIPYPVLFETLHRGLSLALKQTAHHFTRVHTRLEVPHYHALGRRTAVRAAREVDAELTRIARSFDFLLQVTPVNAARAGADFLNGRCEVEPVFDYRPLVVNVGALKRELYDLPFERLEDPTVAHLLRAARDMLDRRITVLGDRNTPRFRYGTLAIYGAVDDELERLARTLLERATVAGEPRGDEEDLEEEGADSASNGRIGADAFAAMATAELDRYRDQHPDLSSSVEVRDDVTGLIVTRGTLMVGSRLNVPVARAEALVQHEVGTHLLTYSNGLAQPLGSLATGLAGYEETQEGLAVLAEHLVGGLTPARLRVLAARVVAVRCMTEGATFVETHRALVRGHGFGPPAAFGICMRVYRSGGLAKDGIYLRGLVELFEYLQGGGNLEPLLVGKVALTDVPAIEELRWREYLNPPRLSPRYLDANGATERLQRVREGRSVLDLLEEAVR